MKTNFKIPANCKRMLLLTGESALIESLPILDLLDENEIESITYVMTDKPKAEIMNDFPNLSDTNINILTSFDHDHLQAIFNDQLMGTKLFISGPWSLIQNVKEIAYTAGFSEDEIQYATVGSKEEKVFCVKCYSLNKMQASNEMTCEHCQTELDVATNFYSKRLDAYLGYIKIG